MQTHVLIFSVTWQLPVTVCIALSCGERFYTKFGCLCSVVPWRHPEVPTATAHLLLPLYIFSYSVLFVCLFLTPGNTQSLQAKAGGAHQPANDMQRCHQQAKEMSARPALQLEQVRNSGLKPYRARLAYSETKVVEWEKSFLSVSFQVYKLGNVQFPLISMWPFAQRCVQSCEEKELELIRDIKTQIKEKENVFFDMEAYLPKRNGWVPLVSPTCSPDDDNFWFSSEIVVVVSLGSTWIWF